MYDFYPEWGPANHRADNPGNPGDPPGPESASSALQASLDLRDNGGQRPDDN